MVKVLARSIREFKKPAILTPLLVSRRGGHGVCDPVRDRSAGQSDAGRMFSGCHCEIWSGAGRDVPYFAGFWRCGRKDLARAASHGFARNLRRDMFYKIQDYSFENIDKFSVSSLVTRMTTDIMNVQMAFMMIIRVAIRCPLMLVFSFAMGFIMGGRLAMIFLFTIPFLAIGLALVIRAAMPVFRRVFRKYDALNDSGPGKCPGDARCKILRA